VSKLPLRGFVEVYWNFKKTAMSQDTHKNWRAKVLILIFENNILASLSL
jgi:hypothetical protein